MLKFQEGCIDRLTSKRRNYSTFIIPDFGLKFFNWRNMFVLINYSTIMFNGANGYIQVSATKISKKMLVTCIKVVSTLHLRGKIVFVEDEIFRQIHEYNVKTCIINVYEMDTERRIFFFNYLVQLFGLRNAIFMFPIDIDYFPKRPIISEIY
jgi:hypothetical protein